MTLATLLVVDCDSGLLHAVRATVAAFMPGVKVVSARSGRQGLDLLRNGGIDAILSDDGMPGMDGLEFLAAAKAMRPWTPGALVTSHPYAQSGIAPWRNAEVKNVLLKPFGPHQLLETITMLLSRRRIKAHARPAVRNPWSRQRYGSLAAKARQ